MENINHKMENLQVKDDSAMDIIEDANEVVKELKPIENDDMDIIEETTSEQKTIENEKVWERITEFVNCLKLNYGNEFYEVKLYDLLLENTGVIHQEQREKHINIFKNFLLENQLAILEQNIEKLNKELNITYSDKIYINLNAIFSKAEKDDQETIWEYLLVLLALVSPNSKEAQNILTVKASHSNTKPTTSGISEDNVFGNLLKTVTEQLQNTDMNEANPMQLIGNIMNSGVMNDLFNSVGGDQPTMDFDFNKMLQNFQEVMTNIQNGPTAGNNNL